MERKLFKILQRKQDCVILQKDMPNESTHRIMYQVRDIENDIIYMGFEYHKAEAIFDSYDLEKVRKERKDLFEDWLTEYAE